MLRRSCMANRILTIAGVFICIIAGIVASNSTKNKDHKKKDK